MVCNHIEEYIHHKHNLLHDCSEGLQISGDCAKFLDQPCTSANLKVLIQRQTADLQLWFGKKCEVRRRYTVIALTHTHKI